MILLAIAIACFVGSIPTAHVVGRLAGMDLRHHGSGNPGTANALRVGGLRMAVAVLTFDLLKGAGAAALGRALVGDIGGLVGGAAAILAQITNPWLGFRGGKGLGVTAGATFVVWPPGILITAVITAAAARALRSTRGALVGLATLVVLAALWWGFDLPNWWGVEPDHLLMGYAVAVSVITSPKFVRALAVERT